MPLQKQLILLVFLGAVFAGLVSLHTVPELLTPAAEAAVEEAPPPEEPAPRLRVRWGPPGSALEGRVRAMKARRPFYGPLPEEADERKGR